MNPLFLTLFLAWATVIKFGGLFLWLGRVLPFLFAVSMTAPRSQVLSKLTRRHGVKVASVVSVENCCLAVGEVVGHENIMSASKMNSAIVIFLNSVEKANELVETGIVVDNLFTPVLPLSMPSKKVLLSNVPPFISDETLVGIMSRYGKLVSPIKKIPIGCGSPLLKHVVSFRRFIYMILKDDEELELSLHLKVDDFDYVIYATTDKMKCFNCGEVGHLIRACPGKTKENSSVNDVNAGEPVEAGPSNAPPPVAGTGAVEESTVVNSSESESAANAIQVIDPKNADEVNVPASAEALNVHFHKSASKTDKKQNDSAVNILQPNLFCDGIEMETEQSEFKVPYKRKKSGDFQAVKAKKADVEVVYGEDEMESGSESSDSSVSLSQSDFSSRSYEVDDIKLFLRATKNKRGVRVDEYFPDTKQFVGKTRLFMSEGLFTNKEVYRLKKIVRKFTSDNANEESEKA